MGKSIDYAIEDGQINKIYYKYKPLNDYTKDMLRTGVIYFNKPHEFNDPYELNIQDSGSYTKDDVIAFFENNNDKKMSRKDATTLANDIMQKYPNIGDFVQEQLEKTKQNIRCKTSIFCIAEKCDILLMWAHYADSHKGVAIGFDISKLEDKFFPYKVKYDQQIPQIKYLTEKNNFLMKWALTKSDHWAYELEHRMILPNRPNTDKIQFPKEAFKEIYFGVNVNITERNSIIKEMLKNGFNPDFYQEILNQQEYKIKFNKIDPSKIP